MIYYEIPATSEPIQEQSFSLFGYNLRFKLRFNSVSALWNFDLFDINKNTYITQAAGLSIRSPVLLGKNFPFIVTMTDGSGLGFNSIMQNEMGKRLRVIFVEKSGWYETVWSTIQANAWQ